MKTLTSRAVVIGLVGVLMALALSASAEAQMRASSAEIVRAAGRVDILPKGQGTWVPGTIGARLVEGDQIRALAGGSADLNLPDGSTILVAENQWIVANIAPGWLWGFCSGVYAHPAGRVGNFIFYDGHVKSKKCSVQCRCSRIESHAVFSTQVF